MHGGRCLLSFVSFLPSSWCNFRRPRWLEFQFPTFAKLPPYLLFTLPVSLWLPGDDVLTFARKYSVLSVLKSQSYSDFSMGMFVDN